MAVDGTALRFVNVAAALFIALVLVPYSFLTAKRHRMHAYGTSKAELEAIGASQERALRDGLEVERQLRDLASSFAALQLQAKEELARPAAPEGKPETAQVADGGEGDDILAFAKDLRRDLKGLGDKVTKSFADIESKIFSVQYKFLVKWHSDDGVKTSKRFEREVDALDFYNQVGEFAKKLLLFQGESWIAVRNYGGEKWLACMTDDAAPQVGECKPPSKKKESVANDGGPLGVV